MTATPPEALTLETLQTPIGPILVAADDQGRLCGVEFWNDEAAMRKLLQRHFGSAKVASGKVAASLHAAFDRYFAGDAEALTSVPWRTGGTAFQQTVWKALTTIPVGETWSYAQLAAAIGKPSAVRAVGLANGANPVPIVIPCHRVIGKSGALTGFGGGLERKRWLLRHEGAAFNDTAGAHETRAVARRLEQGAV